MQASRWVPRTPILLALVALLCPVAASRAADAQGGTLGTDRPWRHYATAGIEVYSTASEADSRTLLRNLQAFRLLFADWFKVEERSPVPVTVYLFRKHAEFIAYGPPWLAQREMQNAYSLTYADRFVFAVEPRGIDTVTTHLYTKQYTGALELALHQYVHDLYMASAQRPMLWYAEGMADLLATAEMKDDRLEIGRPPLGHIQQLLEKQLLPFPRLFGVRATNAMFADHNQPMLFRAQAWCLLHYLYFGETQIPRPKVDRFVRTLGDEKSATAADAAVVVRDTLGLDFATLEKRLNAYATKASFRTALLPVAGLPAASSYTGRDVEPAEMKLRLADLAWRARDAGDARLALVEAKSGQDPRVFELLGTMALQEKDERLALEQWTRALELGSANSALPRLVLHLELSSWLQRFDYDLRMPAEVTARLRAIAVASLRAEPQQGDMYEYLAWIEAFSPEPSVSNANLVQTRFRQITGKAKALVALAMVRARAGKPDEARALLDRLPQLPADPQADAIAQLIRAKLAPR